MERPTKIESPTRGNVGKRGVFSRPTATKLIRVPRHHGTAKYAMPPITYPGTTAAGEAAKALTKKLVSIYEIISCATVAGGWRMYNHKAEVGKDVKNTKVNALQKDRLSLLHQIPHLYRRHTPGDVMVR